MKPGAGSHNIRNKLYDDRDKMTKTATATLTKAEAEYSLIEAVHPSAAIALTLPTASADQAGSNCKIRNSGAAAVTVVSAGFGGGNATVTLARGETGEFECDGTYWFNNSVGAAA